MKYIILILRQEGKPDFSVFGRHRNEPVLFVVQAVKLFWWYHQEFNFRAKLCRTFFQGLIIRQRGVLGIVAVDNGFVPLLQNLHKQVLVPFLNRDEGIIAV